jgi:3-hydroxyisobutyryl-CoA hydrolase
MQAIKAMNKMSPTSLKVCHRELTLGRNMTLEECLKMEYRMAANHQQFGDFKEGIDALLIRRDKNPKFNPKELKHVKDDYVDKFFAPLVDGEELKLL